MNLYAYVGNDPVNFTDPSGLLERGFSVRPAAINHSPSAGRGPGFGGGVKEEKPIVVTGQPCGRACQNSRDHPIIMMGFAAGGAAGTSEGAGRGDGDGDGERDGEGEDDDRPTDDARKRECLARLDSAARQVWEGSQTGAAGGGIIVAAGAGATLFPQSTPWMISLGTVGYVVMMNGLVMQQEGRGYLAGWNLGSHYGLGSNYGQDLTNRALLAAVGLGPSTYTPPSQLGISGLCGPPGG